MENYSFKKRQREIAQRKKREEKLQRKLGTENMQPSEPIQEKEGQASI